MSVVARETVPFPDAAGPWRVCHRGACPLDAVAAPAGIDAADLRALGDAAEAACAAIRREMAAQKDGSLGRDVLAEALMDLRVGCVKLVGAAAHLDLYTAVVTDA